MDLTQAIQLATAAATPITVLFMYRATLRKTRAETVNALANADARTQEAEAKRVEAEGAAFRLMLDRIKFMEEEVNRLKAIVDSQQADLRAQREANAEWERKYARLLLDHDALKGQLQDVLARSGRRPQRAQMPVSEGGDDGIR